jgi:hypothetical protein
MDKRIFIIFFDCHFSIDFEQIEKYELFEL